METKKKTANWIVILLLIFFFPVGLFLMWRNTQWKKVVKWIVTGIIILFSFTSLISSATKAPATTTQPTVQPTTTANGENKNTTPTAMKVAEVKPTARPIPSTPPSTKTLFSTPTVGLTSTPPPDVVTLDSLALVLVDFNVNQSNDRFIGFSKDGQSNITLIGDKNNIKTIMLSLNNSEVKATYNLTLLQSTIQTVLPNWQESNTWLENALTRFSNSTDTEGDFVETDVDNKHILFGYSPSNNSENLTITIK